MKMRLWKLAGWLVLGVAGVAAIGKTGAPSTTGAVPGGVVHPLPALAVLSPAHFTPGLYQLRMLDRPGQPAVLSCLSRPEQLIRLRHIDAAGCSHLVVENASDRATVQYSCPAGEWGRTAVRAVDTRLFKIDTQGISNREPFDQQVEAQRMGGCAQH